MKNYALLLGSAPEGFSQKKLNDMRDTLASEKGLWAKCGIVSFPNGASEKTLKHILENIKNEIENAKREKEAYCNLAKAIQIQKSESLQNGLQENAKIKILLYICTLSPVADEDKSVWLGGEEIRKSVIEEFCEFCRSSGNNVQVIYDCDRDFVPDEETDDDEEVFSAGFGGFSRSAGEME